MNFSPPPGGPLSSGSGFRGGKILRFEGASGETDRAELNALLASFGEVKYIDFRFGDTSGYVRFRTPESAQAALVALTATPRVIAGQTPSWRLLRDEEAAAYWEASKKTKVEELRVRQQPGGMLALAPQPMDHGIVLHFDGANTQTDRTELTAACGGPGVVAYVDFRFGATSGYVRFKTPEAALAALTGFAAKPREVAGARLNWRLLSEQEEVEYRDGVCTRKRQRDGALAAARVGRLSCVVRFEGCGPETERNALQAVCAPFGEVAFVDFHFGETTGYVRFLEAGDAQAAAAALSASPPRVGGMTPTWRLLGQAEAVAYRDKVEEEKRGPARQGGGKGTCGKGGARSAPRGWGGGGWGGGGWSGASASWEGNANGGRAPSGWSGRGRGRGHGGAARPSDL